MLNGLPGPFLPGSTPAQLVSAFPSVKLPLETDVVVASLTVSVRPSPEKTVVDGVLEAA